MKKALIIVESPAKARTIERFLGRRYLVRASKGHIRDLPKSQFGVDVENGFTPKYITIRGKGDTIKELKETAKKAGKVYLATDPDREGEAISWHLAEILGLSPSEARRITFHEITEEAVDKALKEPKPIDLGLVNAQQARRVLDRLVGYKLSPLLWRKVRRGLSAGRVQSVALRLVVEREEEIEAFRPEEYWTITLTVATTEKGASFTARFHGHGEEKAVLRNEADTQAVMATLAAEGLRVVSLKTREKRRFPSPTFTTSTLQQEAGRRLNYTVRRTMSIAQKLYEGLDIKGEGAVGLITYMRTDSTRVAAEAQAEAREYLRESFGAEYVGSGESREKERPGVQGAHEAIRPTKLSRTPAQVKESLTPEQWRLYKLIWERFLASQMKEARIETKTIELAAGSERFRATGSRVVFPGFLAVYATADEEEETQALPEVTEGAEVIIRESKPEQHFTEPPARYTEAALVKILEEKGIGRPSTYAPTIETISDRGYVQREERRLYPTELGRMVIGMLREHFSRILDYEFTAALEEELDGIEEGRIAWQRVVEEFYGPFMQELTQAEGEIPEVTPPVEETDEVCPNCGRPMLVKYSRYGKFLACSGFPECRGTKPFHEPTGVKCPKCGGDVVLKRTRKGRRFYGCANYPTCDFTSWKLPAAPKCPECDAPLTEGQVDGQPVLRCTNELCDYQVPQP